MRYSDNHEPKTQNAGAASSLAYPTLGELGRVIVVVSGPDEIRLDAEVFAGDPTTRERRG